MLMLSYLIGTMPPTSAPGLRNLWYAFIAVNLSVMLIIAALLAIFWRQLGWKQRAQAFGLLLAM
jgi:hypothetical protein